MECLHFVATTEQQNVKKKECSTTKFGYHSEMVMMFNSRLSSLESCGTYSQLSTYRTDILLLRTPHYYGQELSPLPKLQLKYIRTSLLPLQTFTIISLFHFHSLN